MNKGKNKGKIQKSRQNAEGREAGSFLGKAFDSYHKFLSNKVINFVINMILAIGTVLPVSYTHLDVYKRQDYGFTFM